MVASIKLRISARYCLVLNWMSTDVSEVHAAFTVREMSEPSAKGPLVI
jgi:hypothetical protein